MEKIDKKNQNCNVTNNISIYNSNVAIGCCNANNITNECEEQKRILRELILRFVEGGKYHNEVLGYVGVNANPSVVSPKERYVIARKYVGKPDNWKEEESRIRKIESDLKQGKPMFQIVTEGNNVLSDEALKVVEKVDEIFNYVIEVINKEERALNPKEFADKVYIVVDEIIRTHKIEFNKEKDTVNEFGYMIGFCILATYSYSFWYDAAIHENNAWYNILDIDDSKSIKAPPRWLRRIGQALVAVGKDIVSYCDAREENGIIDSIGVAASQSVTAFTEK
ncbi:MAG TPA: hypothetical protein PLO05_11145 [Bacteroidales bacterium]|jgi:hypothetical protein|nr:hypothetical protein [Acholeplasmatales bacterium]HRW22000.1 hypothetical protein [Bacteroidales bacterium]HXK82703.1 hypothetical protein [Bacteroidales bacterium]